MSATSSASGKIPLLLANRLSPGDVCVMTAAIKSLHLAYPGRYEVAVESACPAIFENSPDVVNAGDIPNGRRIDMQYPLIQECNQRAVHMMQGYCDFLAGEIGKPVPLLVNRPCVYLSEQERGWMDQVEQTWGKKRPFWLVNAGVKQCFTAKQWPWFQQVVDSLQGRICFVQVGRTEHVHAPLRGVLNLLGKTDDRQLIRLVHHCQGVLCGTTLLMHLAAALQKPSVILAGGREPRQWNAYPLQNYLSTVGMLDCCKTEACWRSRTVKLNDGQESDNSLCDLPVFTEPPAPTCMAMIGAEEVVGILSRYL